MRQGVEVLIDYFTFTVKEASDPKTVICDWLKMDVDLFQDEEFSVLRGYTHMMWFSNIYVAYAGRDHLDKTGNKVFDGQKMGVCVSMSGNGCRTFERFSSRGQCDQCDTDGGCSPFISLFADIVTDGKVNVSRCDVACDDKSGILPLDEIFVCIDRQDLNTRLSSFTVDHNYKRTRNGLVKGIGVYIGSPKSDFRMRIYDKAMEQGTEGHWVRCEMVFRHEEALGFVYTLISSAVAIGELAAQVLNDKCSFIYRDDTNISRCTVREWWADFVATIQSVALVSRKRVQQPVERIAEWFRHSCGPTVAMLARTFGLFWLADVASESVDRLGAKREALIRDFNSFHRAVVPSSTEKESVSPALSEYKSYDFGEAFQFAGHSYRWEQIPISV